MGEIVTMRPRASAKDSSGAETSTGQSGSKTPASGLPRAAQATILNLPIEPDPEGLDRASKIMRAAVTYTSLNGALNGAWIAEHTGNSTVAEIVVEGMCQRRDATLRKLTRLIDRADAARTVEIWSLASLAKVVLDQNGDRESGSNLEPFEISFLQSFFRLVERDCKRRERDQ